MKMKKKKSKKFTVNFLVDEDELIEAYMHGHDIEEEKDCPPLEDMIFHELNWVARSGISIIGGIPKIT
jgi:DNA-binding phage protein